jgi:hypothetical protein
VAPKKTGFFGHGQNNRKGLKRDTVFSPIRNHISPLLPWIRHPFVLRDCHNRESALKTVDPVVYLNFAAQYTSKEVIDNSLIIVSEDKSRYIGSGDIYETSYI